MLKQSRTGPGKGVVWGENKVFCANINEGVRYGSNSIIASQENLGRLASDHVSLYFL